MSVEASFVPKIRFHGAMVFADSGETNVSTPAACRDYFDLKEVSGHFSMAWSTHIATNFVSKYLGTQV